MVANQNNFIYQFKIALSGTDPPIRRRIQVPSTFNFWDFHVALQDSMGWLDYHLHAFRFPNRPKHRAIEIGISGDSFADNPR